MAQWSGTLTRSVAGMRPHRPGGHVYVACTLAYASTDPLAVRVAFPGVHGQVVATLSRDLLEEGLVRPGGRGVVRVAPVDDEEWVRLEVADSGQAGAVFLPWDDVAQFLDATFDLVPRSGEAALVGVDALIDQILEAAPDR